MAAQEGTLPLLAEMLFAAAAAVVAAVELEALPNMQATGAELPSLVLRLLAEAEGVLLALAARSGSSSKAGKHGSSKHHR